MIESESLPTPPMTSVKMPVWVRVHLTPDHDRAFAREQGVPVAAVEQHRAELVQVGLLRQDEHGSWWLKRGAP